MGATIMLVDNESINNMIHKKVIQMHRPNVEILSFTNPEDALWHLVSHANPVPQVIFLDINMPEMSAWDFLDALPEELLSSIYVYICTGSESLADVERSKSYPLVKGFVLKPLQPHIAQEILNMILI